MHIYIFVKPEILLGYSRTGFLGVMCRNRIDRADSWKLKNKKEKQSCIFRFTAFVEGRGVEVGIPEDWIYFYTPVWIGIMGGNKMDE